MSFVDSELKKKRVRAIDELSRNAETQKSKKEYKQKETYKEGGNVGNQRSKKTYT